MGKNRICEVTNTVERVTSLCEENTPIVGFTLFFHRNIHNLTLTLPEGRTQSHINHITINIKTRGSLQDVRMTRNADVGSDHNLRVAKMNLKLTNATIGLARNQQPDIKTLKDTVLK